jgi:hypothetical protein
MDFIIPDCVRDRRAHPDRPGIAGLHPGFPLPRNLWHRLAKTFGVIFVATALPEILFRSLIQNWLLQVR